MKLKNNKCISIDIGTNYVKFAIGQYKDKHLQIDELISKEIDDGIIEDGKIVDFEKLKKFLQKVIWGKGIDAKKITFTISTSDVIKRIVEVPVVDDSDRESLIKYEIEQYLPDEIDNYNLQYIILEEININDQMSHKILVAVIPEEVTKAYFEMAKEMKLIPISLDIQSNSIIKFINYNYGDIKDEKGEYENAIVLDLGYSTMNITIIESNRYTFNRVINKGTKEIIEFISNQGINLEEISLNQILEIRKEELADIIYSWINEINKIINFYKSRNRDKELKKIFIYGGDVFIKYASIYLEEQLDLKIEVLDLNKKFDLISKDETEHLPTYMNAIGALITK